MGCGHYRLMQATGMVGYPEADVGELAKGAFPQHRLLKNAPRELATGDLEGIYRDALRYW